MPMLHRIPWLVLILTGSLLLGCSKDENENPEGNTPEQSNNENNNDTPAGKNTPEQAARSMLNAVKENRLDQIWNGLPASYQQDLNQIVRDFASKMDPEIWNAGMTTLKKSVQVLETKKEFVLNNSKFQEELNGMGLDPEKVSEEWPKFIATCQTIVNSELTDLDQLKQFEGESFMQGTANTAFKQIRELTESYSDEDPIGEVAETKITVVNSEDNLAVLKMEEPGEGKEPVEVNWIKVEEKWLPEDVNAGLQFGIMAGKDMVENLDPKQFQEKKTPILVMIRAIDANLERMLAAETQEEFDEAVNDLSAVTEQFRPKDQPAPEFDPDFPPAPEFNPDPATTPEENPEANIPADDDTINIVFTKQVAEEDLKPLWNQLMLQTDDANTALVNSLSEVGPTELTVFPVKDPQAFSEKLSPLLKEQNLGQIKEVKGQTITVEVTKP